MPKKSEKNRAEEIGLVTPSPGTKPMNQCHHIVEWTYLILVKSTSKCYNFHTRKWIWCLPSGGHFVLDFLCWCVFHWCWTTVITPVWMTLHPVYIQGPTLTCSWEIRTCINNDMPCFLEDHPMWLLIHALTLTHWPLGGLTEIYLTKYVNIGSGNDSTRLLPLPRLTQIYVAIWHH